MAILSINELADGRRGPVWGADNSRTYTIPREIITDGTDTEVDVVTSPLIAQPFVNYYDLDPNAICIRTSFAFNQDDHSYGIHVAEYSTKSAEIAAILSGGSPGQAPGSGGNPETATRPDNPIDRRPHVTLSTKMIKHIRMVDLDQRPVVNAAEDPFETVLIDVPHLCIDVERNIESFDYTLLNRCTGGVNDAPFIGYPTQKVKCELLTAKDDFENKQYFWRVRAQLIVGNDSDLISANVVPAIAASVGWHWTWKLNAGFNTVTAGGTREPILTVPGGQRPARPVPLSAQNEAVNGVRTMIAVTQVTPGQAVNWCAFRFCRLSPLGEIGLFD